MQQTIPKDDAEKSYTCSWSWRKYRIEIHSESIRTIPTLSDICIRANANHSEPIRKTFRISFDGRRSKINPSSDWFGLIWIKNLVSKWIEFIRIDVSELIGLSRIDFWPFFVKWRTKRFLDWFGMIRIGSDTDIGMNFNQKLFSQGNFFRFSNALSQKLC